MQAPATITPSDSGPWRMKRGLLSWVAAQARTQSSHRVQRSRSISMAARPFMKRWATMNSRKLFASGAAGGAAGFRRQAPGQRGELGRREPGKDVLLQHGGGDEQRVHVAECAQAVAQRPEFSLPAGDELAEAEGLALAEVALGALAVVVAAGSRGQSRCARAGGRWGSRPPGPSAAPAPGARVRRPRGRGDRRGASRTPRRSRTAWRRRSRPRTSSDRFQNRAVSARCRRRLRSR
jgi:hypothetical protein